MTMHKFKIVIQRVHSRISEFELTVQESQTVTESNSQFITELRQRFISSNNEYFQLP